MKLYRHKDEGLPIEEIEPAELAEITLVATPEELSANKRFEFARVACPTHKVRCTLFAAQARR